MAVIRSEEIKTRLALDLDDPASLVITPILSSNPYDADSVDLRLGNHFLIPNGLQKPYFSHDADTGNRLYNRVFVPFGDYIVVPAHQTILGATLEFIKLPYDLCGEILTKSSVARSFVLIETAPWIHPRYRGCLTLEIANVSNTPVLLYPGRFIGQLILLQLSSSIDINGTELTEGIRKEGRLSGNYFGPVYPEPPRFNEPEVDFRRIGICRTHLIRDFVHDELENCNRNGSQVTDVRDVLIRNIDSYATVVPAEDHRADATVLADQVLSFLTVDDDDDSLNMSSLRLVTGFSSEPTVLFPGGTFIGGESIGLKNIRIRLSDLLSLGKNVVGLGSGDAWKQIMGVLCLIKALYDIFHRREVRLSAGCVEVLWKLWELDGMTRAVTEDDLVRVLCENNTVVTGLSRSDVIEALNVLSSIGCIQADSEQKGWLVCEEIQVAPRRLGS